MAPDQERQDRARRIGLRRPPICGNVRRPIVNPSQLNTRRSFPEKGGLGRLAPGLWETRGEASQDDFRNAGSEAEKMVLPDRIELSTSPLPMECSTTELRQRAPHQENRPKRPLQGGPILATRPGSAQAQDRPPALRGSENQALFSAVAFKRLNCGPIRFPISSPSAASALNGRTMTSNSIISPASPNLMRSMPLSCHFPILAENSSAAS